MLKEIIEQYPELNRRKRTVRRSIDQYPLNDWRRLTHDGSGIVFKPKDGGEVRAWEGEYNHATGSPEYVENRRPKYWWKQADRRKP